MINLLSRQYMSIAYSIPITNRESIGIGLIGLDNSLVEQKTHKNVRIKKSLGYQIGLIIAYSRNIFPVSIGASIRYVGLGEKHEETFDDISSFGLDLGFSYIINSTLRVGLIYQSPFDIKWNNYPDEFIPGRMGISAVWMPAYFTEQLLQFLLSLDRYENEMPQMNYGIVITAIHDKFGMKKFEIRAGLGNFELELKNENSLSDYLNDSAPTVTIGAGFGINTGLDWVVHLDYCFQIQEYINSKHIVTTRIAF
jgi:hypothetical protein